MSEFGNLNPSKMERMTSDDIFLGAEQVHISDTPVPNGVSVEDMQEVIVDLLEANRASDRMMGPGSLLAWGIVIGVNAERNRMERLLKKLQQEIL